MTYAKTSPPALPGILQRTRLYRFLDRLLEYQAVWIQGLAGAGKTTLIAGYIEQRDLPSLWYRLDAGDNDAATFFHYFGLAGTELLSAQHRPLPRLTPEA